MNDPKCPYCGGVMKHHTEKVVDWSEVYRHNLKCECGATSPYADNLINAVKVAMLRPPQKPLTLEELKQMPGEPVWVQDAEAWAIVECPDKPGAPLYVSGVWVSSNGTSVNFTWDVKKRGLTCWKRKPTDEEIAAAKREV